MKITFGLVRSMCAFDVVAESWWAAVMRATRQSRIPAQGLQLIGVEAP